MQSSRNGVVIETRIGGRGYNSHGFLLVMDRWASPVLSIELVSIRRGSAELRAL